MATADTYPHIVLANDRKAVIEGTRYTVEHIAAEQYFYGWSAEEILRQHPDLRPAEVYAALAYFHDHHDSMVAAIEAAIALGFAHAGVRDLFEVHDGVEAVLARLATLPAAADTSAARL